MKSDDTQQPGPDDPRVVEALDEYLAALEAGHKPDRRTFLAGHADIAGPLDECLAALEALHQSSSVAGRPASAPAAPADWQPGAVLGDFRIVREVGRGGMGVVYEAEQVSLGRRIALKVLPFALTLDPRQLQRFKNEARAAAQLHHQHIVPVYYVGSERGVHFYAMQYIDGQSLAEVIQGLRPLPSPARGPSDAVRTTRPKPSVGEPTGPYPEPPQTRAVTTAVRPVDTLATAYSSDSRSYYPAVARLGMQAAEALEHAHGYGIVHRDIKPANLMLDAHGHLWVTDFGLAQFQTDAGLTQSGDLLGTLRYMSPEQAGGRRVLLDHRTDVYSLGATLYELLTLQPLFDGADRQTLLQQILHDEPRPPRVLRKSVPVELETIVLKCLEKDVDRRYASARELADDLRRFLTHEPIRARRATPVQRLRKWARRHPTVMWAGAVLCLLTVVGSLISAGLLRVAYERERQRAREAEERFVLAREELDGMFKLCEEELADRPHLESVRRLLLENFLVYYQRLIEQRRDDPAAQAELAASQARVQQILDDLAVLQGAGQHKLLKERAVLADLRLEQGQGEMIQKVMEEMDRRWGASFRDFGRLNAEERRDLFLRLARETEADLDEVLTTQQRQRLRQIELQQKGDRAFEEPEVTAALKLTAAQKEQIRALREKAFFRGRHHHEGPVGGPPPGPPGRPGGPHPPPGPALVKQIEMDVLTAEQLRRWREMTGEPFKGPPPDHRPGPPPGPH
jgi:serine/threonine protein kinase